MRHSQNKKDADQQGFTIVELLIAMIVGLLFIGSANTIVNNYLRIGTKSKNIVIANSYAEGKIEALRNAGYNSLTDGTTDLSAELPTDLSRPDSASLAISSPATGLKQVDISLNYTDQGVSRNLSYTTYIGELGVGQ